MEAEGEEGAGGDETAGRSEREMVRHEWEMSYTCRARLDTLLLDRPVPYSTRSLAPCGSSGVCCPISNILPNVTVVPDRAQCSDFERYRCVAVRRCQGGDVLAEGAGALVSAGMQQQQRHLKLYERQLELQHEQLEL